MLRLDQQICRPGRRHEPGNGTTATAHEQAAGPVSDERGPVVDEWLGQSPGGQRPGVALVYQPYDVVTGSTDQQALPYWQGQDGVLAMIGFPPESTGFKIQCA